MRKSVSNEKKNQDDPAVGSLITNAREKKQADVNGYLHAEVILEKADMQDVKESTNLDNGEAHNNKTSHSDLPSQHKYRVVKISPLSFGTNGKIITKKLKRKNESCPAAWNTRQ